MVTYTFTNGETADADEVNQNFTDVEQDVGLLGEVRMFALSMTGAVTKASLQGKGWAICDGTTPASQGITSPTIETTPDLQEKFIRMSDDETSGTTGGSNDDHNHRWYGVAGTADNWHIALEISNNYFQSFNSAGGQALLPNGDSLDLANGFMYDQVEGRVIVIQELPESLAIDFNNRVRSEVRRLNRMEEILSQVGVN